MVVRISFAKVSGVKIEMPWRGLGKKSKDMCIDEAVLSIPLAVVAGILQGLYPIGQQKMSRYFCLVRISSDRKKYRGAGLYRGRPPDRIYCMGLNLVPCLLFHSQRDKNFEVYLMRGYIKLEAGIRRDLMAINERRKDFL